MNGRDVRIHCTSKGGTFDSLRTRSRGLGGVRHFDSADSLKPADFSFRTFSLGVDLPFCPFVAVDERHLPPKSVACLHILLLFEPSDLHDFSLLRAAYPLTLFSDYPRLPVSNSSFGRAGGRWGAAASSSASQACAGDLGPIAQQENDEGRITKLSTTETKGFPTHTDNWPLLGAQRPRRGPTSPAARCSDRKSSILPEDRRRSTGNVISWSST